MQDYKQEFFHSFFTIFYRFYAPTNRRGRYAHFRQLKLNNRLWEWFEIWYAASGTWVVLCVGISLMSDVNFLFIGLNLWWGHLCPVDTFFSKFVLCFDVGIFYYIIQYGKIMKFQFNVVWWITTFWYRYPFKDASTNLLTKKLYYS